MVYNQPFRWKVNTAVGWYQSMRGLMSLLVMCQNTQAAAPVSADFANLAVATRIKSIEAWVPPTSTTGAPQFARLTWNVVNQVYSTGFAYLQERPQDVIDTSIGFSQTAHFRLTPKAGTFNAGWFTQQSTAAPLFQGYLPVGTILEIVLDICIQTAETVVTNPQGSFKNQAVTTGATYCRTPDETADGLNFECQFMTGA